jgi:hypothetical protein
VVTAPSQHATTLPAASGGGKGTDAGKGKGKN